ncbi:hypothetical protein NA56DRAFT_698442 [Hyaloscypha hepaticicola]|uniref:Uncharacterized protein n=1 Tax=Hyaloscypha hepaticicola TaxID=2082293 RepID=A0A2J6QJ55_9HELO|nr:hypothetical protein NA56DRAFT_698442 [Hyaloscypha hepaticicola]
MILIHPRAANSAGSLHFAAVLLSITKGREGKRGLLWNHERRGQLGKVYKRGMQLVSKYRRQELTDHELKRNKQALTKAKAAEV